MVVMPGLSLCTSCLPCWPALLGLHTYCAVLGQQNALKYFGCNSPWAGHPGSGFHSDHLCTVCIYIGDPDAGSRSIYKDTPVGSTAGFDKMSV